MSHHNLEKYDYNAIFYAPRTLFTMGITLLVLNYLAHNVVPLLDASDFDENDP